MNKAATEIIILGSTGVIGSKLATIFIEAGYVTHCLARDNNLLEQDISDKDFIIINCAFSFSGSLGQNKRLLDSTFEFVKKANVIYFINMSTIDAYSNPSDGFNLKNLPDTVYGKVKRQVDLFITEELSQFTKVHFLLLGAVSDNASAWSLLIDGKYFKDKKYVNEAIPVINVNGIYDEILKINSRSKKYIKLSHRWLCLRNLKFTHNRVFCGLFFRLILRSKLVSLVQKVFRKIGIVQSIQSDLILFERLSERSKNYDT